jgi:malonate transporter
MVVATIKLFLLPAIVAIFLQWRDLPVIWNELLLLTAAGPLGAMAFALAILYNVRTDTIAPVIIWTSIMTLFSLAWLA